MAKKKKPTIKTKARRVKKTSRPITSPKKKTVKKPAKKTVKKTVKKTSQKRKTKPKPSLPKTANRHKPNTPKEKKVTRATRMLQLASNMVSYQMLLSHLLRPISGEPLADGSSLDEMSEQFRIVKKQLLSELAHNPVMSLKISSAYKQLEELWKAHQSMSPDNPDIERIRLEAKEASVKSKETCAAMSDLVAALRCIQ